MYPHYSSFNPSSTAEDESKSPSPIRIISPHLELVEDPAAEVELSLPPIIVEEPCSSVHWEGHVLVESCGLPSLTSVEWPLDNSPLLHLPRLDTTHGTIERRGNTITAQLRLPRSERAMTIVRVTSSSQQRVEISTEGVYPSVAGLLPHVFPLDKIRVYDNFDSMNLLDQSAYIHVVAMVVEVREGRARPSDSSSTSNIKRIANSIFRFIAKFVKKCVTIFCI